MRRMHRVACAAIAAIGILAPAVLRAQQPAAALPQPSAEARASVQAGIVVRPDTVTVGDPFAIVVRVRMPAQAQLIWPALDDTTATIALRVPMTRRDGPSNVSGREEFGEFEVAAWDTGQVTTGWPPALVIVGEDTVPILLADVGVFVRSVLSADTLEHIPRPAKPAFERLVPWWERWWPALALLAAVLLALAYAYWRRRRPVLQPHAALPQRTAYEHAMHAFDRLERLALTDAGEYGRATTLALDVLRGYMAARIPVTSRAQTSAELLAAVGDDARVPLPALIELLVVSDAVKFARRQLSAAETRRITGQARAVVEGIESVEVARRAQAEQQARELAEREAAANGDDGGTSAQTGDAKREPTGVA